MDPRLPALLDRPVAFGPIDQAAATRGATGLSATAWLSADGVAVLSPAGHIGRRLRRRPIAQLDLHQLPATVTSLAEAYRSAGSPLPLSLDIGDPAAFEIAVASARQAGAEADLWLCHPDLATLTSWRSKTSARLINAVARSSLDGGLERRAAELEQRGIDGLRLDHRSWTGGKVALLHRFGRLALGAGAVHDREVGALLDAGIDAVYSDRIEPMAAMLAEFYGLI